MGDVDEVALTVLSAWGVVRRMAGHKASGGALVSRIWPYGDHDGSERTSVVIHDLTEREAAEAALHESEELYRSILKASPDDNHGH